MQEISLFHSLSISNLGQGMTCNPKDSSAKRYFSCLPNPVLQSILEILAQKLAGKRSVLRTCKAFYYQGFIAFHKTITSKCFSSTVKANYKALSFFILAGGLSTEAILPQINLNDFHGEIRALDYACMRGQVEVVEQL